MRKVQQTKILELLATLQKANEELLKMTIQNHLVPLLADCQEFAFQIGQYIETIEGKNTKTVALLEEYCELAYQASSTNDSKRYIEELKLQLSKIENSVHDELKPNKIEVVFFPYLLSMFDSLESIYLAAKADPHCDAYVVPIPWFDKLGNGELGEMHYDGSQYPAHIPITNWQEYDVEARHPDIIFIHNPYDNYNHISSVHPNYYSKRLRECTDLLVYVPYFIFTDNIQESLCITMGCVYSHKTIVQSEKVRDTYIQVFKKNFGSHLGNSEDKFIALGSPKYDAVSQNNQKEFTLPESWRKLVFRPDGTKKPLLLYNTSVGAALLDGQQYLAKLCHVLDTFKKRSDVVLWWRPHPLNQAMYQSMRPQLLEKYESIVAEYKQEGWGIYDDTPDLHRAISMSDAYIGDQSSLVPLYQATGKLVLYTEFDLFLNPIFTNDACFSENHLLLTVNDADLFASINLENGEVLPIEYFPHNPYYNQQYYTAYAVENKVFFSPYNAKEIAVYDKSNRKMTYIPLASYIGNLPAPYCGCIKQYKRSLYIMPINFPGILEYGIDSGSITVHSGWEKEVEALAFEKITTITLRGRPCIIDDKLFIACENANAVLEFHMDTHCWHIEKIGEEKFSYINIYFDGESCWLLGRNQPVLIRKTSHSAKILHLSQYTATDKTYSYSWCAKYGEYLWLLPNTGSRVLKISVKNNQIVKDDYLKDYLETAERQKVCKFTFAALHNSKIWLMPAIGNSLFCIDAETDSEEAIRLSINPAVTLDDIKPYMLPRTTFLESSILSLDIFLDYVAQSKLPTPVQQEAPFKSVGEKIYEYCRDFLF